MGYGMSMEKIIHLTSFVEIIKWPYTPEVSKQPVSQNLPASCLYIKASVKCTHSHLFTGVWLFSHSNGRMRCYSENVLPMKAQMFIN